MRNSWLKNTPFCSKGLFNNTDIVENSIPAIAKAVDCGYNLFLNLTLTKDKQLVVCDNKKISILLNCHKKIENITSDDKENLKLLNTDSTVPLLSEVLHCVAGKVDIIFRIANSKQYKKIITELIKQLAYYKGKTAIVAANYPVYFFVRKLKKDYPCGLILKKDSSRIVYNAILLANTTFFKLIKPDFIICDINNLPNKYLDNYLLSNPYSYIISRTVLDKQNYKTALDYSDNYVFENYIPQNQLH